MSEQDEHVTYILSAEFVGMAEPVGGFIYVGGVPVRWTRGCVGVYVRRYSSDLEPAEIHLTSHDGLSQEELDEQNRQAEEYPLGPKEYWRGEMVGKYTYGVDNHTMTNAEFESDWAEGEDE